jgi:hypothetical protein
MNRLIDEFVTLAIIIAVPWVVVMFFNILIEVFVRAYP